MQGGTKEFLILPLLCGLSHVAADSEVTAWKGTFCEPNVIFAVVVAQSSAGKSPAMKLMKKALVELDEINGVSPNDSKQINGIF
jgi:hypothetical protein